MMGNHPHISHPHEEQILQNRLGFWIFLEQNRFLDIILLAVTEVRTLVFVDVSGIAIFFPFFFFFWSIVIQVIFQPLTKWFVRGRLLLISGRMGETSSLKGISPGDVEFVFALPKLLWRSPLKKSLPRKGRKFLEPRRQIC